MMRRSEQNRLGLQRNTRFTRLQDALDDIPNLITAVAYADESGLLSRGPVRSQVFGKALGREGDYRVRGIQDGLGRAVVLLKRDDVRRRREQAGEVEDVADLGRPEGVDRLGIVTDDGHPASIRLHSRQNQRLEAVGILILIHQHMLEALADCVRERWLT